MKKLSNHQKQQIVGGYMSPSVIMGVVTGVSALLNTAAMLFQYFQTPPTRAHISPTYEPKKEIEKASYTRPDSESSVTILS